ncbi:MAG TPA: HisA/HisF-related TIM barrel protein [Pirellulales bacterium]
MLVVPVLDLLGGVVVRGIAGRRETYRPIESPLVSSARPAEVATALRETFGLTTLYVADLDAIAGRPPHVEACAELQRLGFSLWLDAGLADGRDAARWLDARSPHASSQTSELHLVAGLETLAGPAALADVLRIAGPERTVFSLDLKAGHPLVRVEANWSEAAAADKRSPHADVGGVDPFAIARQAISLGVQRLIVLDLAQVGMGAGVGTESLCRAIAGAFPHVELIAGGGVRSRTDLARLAEAGCRGALVASALHFGPLTRGDVESLGEAGG